VDRYALSFVPEASPACPVKVADELRLKGLFWSLLHRLRSFTDRTGGAGGGGAVVAGGGVTVVAGGEGAGAGLSGSAPLFPPGTITIGRLVGVALGGTHSERPSVANALGGSP